MKKKFFLLSISAKGKDKLRAIVVGKFYKFSSLEKCLVACFRILSVGAADQGGSSDVYRFRTSLNLYHEHPSVLFLGGCSDSSVYFCQITGATLVSFLRNSDFQKYTLVLRVVQKKLNRNGVLNKWTISYCQ